MKGIKGNIKRVFKNDHDTIPTLEEVVHEITGVPIESIQKKGRPREIVEARQIVMALALESGRVSKNYITKHFRFKHHSPIGNAAIRISGFCDTNKKFKKMVDKIREEFIRRITSSRAFDSNIEIYQELKNQL